MSFLVWLILINVALAQSRELAINKIKNEILIVGGRKAVNGEAPYQVWIRISMGSFCGGTIISSRWILTAAHCLYYANPNEIIVHYNFLNINQEFFNKAIVSRIYLNEYYKKYENENDIALIKLVYPLKLNQTNAEAIPLADKYSDPIKDSMVTISGWGQLKQYTGRFPNELNIVNVTVVERNKCKKLYSQTNFIITDNMFCAGDLEYGGKDSCQGDSGGPVVQNGKLVGIVSWGIGCANKNYPGVYTRIGNYIDWIQSKMHE